MKIDIDFIPFGKSLAISRESLKRKFKIKNTDEFRKELSLLRKKYIILSSSDIEGYWRPDTEQEYTMLIDDCSKKILELHNVISIAKNEIRDRGV